MKKFKLKLNRWGKKNSFAKDVITLSSTNLLVQLINLISIPILSRIYEPNDFGLLAIFAAIVQLLTCIATLRYEIPIPNCETNRNALNLIIICMLNISFVTIISLIGIFYISYLDVQFALLSNLGWYLWLIPVSVFACSMFNVFQFYGIRERQYSLIAKTRLKQTFIAISMQFGLGLLYQGAIGLILGFIMQTAVGSLKLLKHLLLNNNYKKNNLYMREIRNTYVQNSSYFKYSTPEAFSQMGALQFPLIIIGIYVNAVEAGLLFMANRIMQLPVGIISSSFAQVFTGSAFESYKNEKLNELFVNTIKMMLRFAIIPVFFLGIGSWFVLPYFLGEEWARAGDIAIWLMAATILQSLSSATNAALYVTSNQRIAFYIHLTGFFIRVFPVAYCSIYFPKYASYTFATSGALHYIFHLAVISVVCKTTKMQYYTLFLNFAKNLFLWIFPFVALIALIKVII